MDFNWKEVWDANTEVWGAETGVWGEVPDSAAQSYIFRINVIVILGWVLRSLQCYVIDYS